MPVIFSAMETDKRKHSEDNLLHPFSKLLTLVACELVEMTETYR